MGTDIVVLALSCYRSSLTNSERSIMPVFLPEGMGDLLRLANGFQDVLTEASVHTGAQPDELRDAARYLILQLCFIPSAGHYRVLGLNPDAPFEQIQEHYRLLIRLFHPDRTAHCNDNNEHVASRINMARRVLSSSESRAVYDDLMLESRHPYSSVSNLLLTLPRRRKPIMMFSGIALGGAILLLIAIYPHLTTPMSFSYHRKAFPDAGMVIRNLEPAVIPVDRRNDMCPVTRPEDQQPGTTKDAQMKQLLAQQIRHENRVQVVQVPEEPDRLEAQVSKFEQPLTKRIRINNEPNTEKTGAERLVSEVEREQPKRSRIKTAPKAEKAVPTLVDRDLASRQGINTVKQQQTATKDAPAELKLAKQSKADNQLVFAQAKAKQTRIEIKTDQSLVKPSNDSAHTMTSTRHNQAESPTPDKAHLTDREAQKLIDQYKDAYRRRDLRTVMSLFATDARSNGSDRRATHRNLQIFFKTMLIQGLEFDDLHWDHRGDTVSMNARYKLGLKQREQGKPSLATGHIRFDLRKQNGKVSIQALHYDWVEDGSSAAKRRVASRALQAANSKKSSFFEEN